LAEFGVSPEDKFKLSLLSVEKRFVELEGAIGEIQQKLQSMQASASEDLEQRVSDMEDLIYVEQAGIEELKGMLENKQEQPGISAEEVRGIVEPIVGKMKGDLENRIGQMRNSLEQMHSQAGSQQISEANEKLSQMEAKLKAIHHFRAELEDLKNKVAPLNPETIKAIVAEISDLRIETGREIREIKEKVGNTPLYADIQFLSNRVKDLKLTVENLLNMKVEIDAKILNMERNLAESGGSGSSAVAVNLISEVEDTKRQLFATQKRISALDAMMKNVERTAQTKTFDSGRQTDITKEIETLYARMNEIYADFERKALDINRLAPMNFGDKVSDMNSKISKLEEELHRAKAKPEGSRIYDDQMKELLEKVILLETRVSVLESNVMEPRKAQPIILE